MLARLQAVCGVLARYVYMNCASVSGVRTVKYLWDHEFESCLNQKWFGDFIRSHRRFACALFLCFLQLRVKYPVPWMPCSQALICVCCKEIMMTLEDLKRQKAANQEMEVCFKNVPNMWWTSGHRKKHPRHCGQNLSLCCFCLGGDVSI